MVHIVEAKVQKAWLTRNEKVTIKRGPEKGKTVARKRRFKVVIGTYIAFDDGCTIVGPDGRVHKGRGTVVRFNYRHGTWSVQRPQRCETNRVGYMFTRQADPCWLKDERESGFSSVDFERSFSPRFVKLCKDGHDLAEMGAGAPLEVTRLRRVDDPRTDNDGSAGAVLRAG